MYTITIWVTWNKENIKLKTDKIWYEVIEKDTADNTKEYINLRQMELQWCVNVCVKNMFVKKKYYWFHYNWKRLIRLLYYYYNYEN